MNILSSYKLKSTMRKYFTAWILCLLFGGSLFGQIANIQKDRSVDSNSSSELTILHLISYFGIIKMKKSYVILLTCIHLNGLYKVFLIAIMSRSMRLSLASL